MDYGAIGNVTNLAARLCGEAAGGQILISARVASAVESLIDAESLGPLTLRGLARPVADLECARPSVISSRTLAERHGSAGVRSAGGYWGVPLGAPDDR